jgi:hypothetical protein
LSSYSEVLIDRFASRGLLIDTNLLLLFVIGQYDPEILVHDSFGRLAAYSLDDFYLLQNLSTLFKKRVTTAHVLAEVSNWIGYLPTHREIECLRQFSEYLSSFDELTTDSLKLADYERFPYLGLTDTALASFANDYLVITDDLRFITHLNKMGREALNINHLRQELWLQS